MEEEETKLVNAEQETLMTLMSPFGKPLNFTAHAFVLLVLGHLFLSQVSSRVTLESVWKLQIKQPKQTLCGHVHPVIHHYWTT